MATSETEVVAGIGNEYRYGFHDPENYFFKSQKGLSKEVVEAISATTWVSLVATTPHLRRALA